MVVVVLGNVASRATFPWVGGPTTTTMISSTSAAATAATAAPTAAPDARSASNPKAKAAVGQDLQGGGVRFAKATAGSSGAGDGGGGGGL